jgi:DNA-binding response OmpR family regulator
MPQRTPSEEFLPLQHEASAFAPEIAEPPVIYVVDDEPLLTELYTIFLKSAGYLVKAFTDRVEALGALEGERRKPDLLVTDYFGSSMLADGFMRRCLIVHPNLRILMASGLSQADVHFFSIRPNRFIQKPFNAEEFLREVKAALVADPGDSL